MTSDAVCMNLRLMVMTKITLQIYLALMTRPMPVGSAVQSNFNLTSELSETQEHPGTQRLPSEIYTLYPDSDDSDDSHYQDEGTQMFCL